MLDIIWYSEMVQYKGTREELAVIFVPYGLKSTQVSCLQLNQSEIKSQVVAENVIITSI